MRSVFGLMLALFATCAMLSGTAQTPEPGCRPTPRAKVLGDASNLNYAVTETAGLNVVVVNAIVGQTTLSDMSCWPDPEQGSLQVVLTYGIISNKPVEEEARASIFTRLAVSHPNRRSADFPPTMVERYDVNGLPGAEAFSSDTTEQGAKVFRYTLVIAFPDGAKAILSASGSSDQFDTLRPKLRSIGAGIRPLRSAKEMKQAAVANVENALGHERGPLVDKALDACLTGAFTSDGAVARAIAAGFPAFQSGQAANGRQVRTTEVPKGEIAAVSLAVMDIPSTLTSGKRSLACLIVGLPALDDMFRQKFEARFSGKGVQRDFIISNNRMSPASSFPGAGPGNAMVRARLLSNATASQIAVEVTPLN